MEKRKKNIKAIETDYKAQELVEELIVQKPQDPKEWFDMDTEEENYDVNTYHRTLIVTQRLC